VRSLARDTLQIVRCLVLAMLLAAACAPPIDGPVERHHAIDRADSARLTVQLA
jgi:hypothetical protein